MVDILHSRSLHRLVADELLPDTAEGKWEDQGANTITMLIQHFYEGPRSLGRRHELCRYIILKKIILEIYLIYEDDLPDNDIDSISISL